MDSLELDEVLVQDVNLVEDHFANVAVEMPEGVVVDDVAAEISEIAADLFA
ncbi:hypothetical protein [Rickettsiales endosymbiont of Stachyamoeba lipophora]|uniref:hypothetical protein n=1 Tax=Rickettsiales endosymbiont of Stachyamoeba lipophora TaxID=2486578 RepID=UPI0013DE57B2|nr:hypothetical protein [Rickettsiales endosymbiont of Stachyamoeba lipophora]